MRKQTRCHALKLPIAVDAKTATFAYVDPGNYTDTELRSWGAAHEFLWRALRGQGIQVQVVGIGPNRKYTIRNETALKRWSNGGARSNKPAVEEMPSHDDPEVKAEMQLIEKAVRSKDREIITNYGGIQRISNRYVALQNLPKTRNESGPF